ncbi:hypothetical protein [Rubinisphaera italica]|uniref:Uncharacterized protein n=1 Tax=Rubinisphaera italica TaxID=2527969 RepID=A0A5C5XCX9_9PLAN|nr:hypothetical protein [Rubinisphaera italica]TWT60840.1 hypothetical protein Pan54_15670 [Rubinisphaera italica]
MAQMDFTTNGVINTEELYTLRTFKKRLDISDHTLRVARRAGLQVRYLHKQGYILGRDWIDYVLNSSRSSQEAEPTSVSS